MRTSAIACVVAGMTVSAAAQLVPQQIVPLPPLTPVIVQFHGASLANVGDLNGDGKPEVAVGSYFSTTFIGRVYVYSSATGAVVRVLVSPNQEVDNFFGSAVAGVPDVNGDGVPDIVVGASNDSPGPSPALTGRVYLYSGATGQYLGRLAPPQEQFAGHFGSSVAGISDINGDGRGDIVVGAPDYNFGALPSAGRVWVYSGATRQLIRELRSPGALDSGSFGYVVAAMPDVNGDGRQDIIVTAPKERPDRAGRVYIYSGATGGLLKKMLPPAPQNDGRFGYAAAAVPDANGDGIADVVVGAPREYNRQGRAYLFSGATALLLRTVQSPGLEDDARFGEAVAGVPDINGDGRGDFVVGAPHEDPATAPDDHGRAYIYSGASGGLLTKMLPPTSASEQYFGYAVLGLPDLNGNGKGEVVVGAPGEDRAPYGQSGMSFIYRY